MSNFPIGRLSYPPSSTGGGGGGTIGGATGATDNAVLRADGVGGVTIQSSDVIISDPAAGVVTVTTISGAKIQLPADLLLAGATADYIKLGLPGFAILQIWKADGSGYAIVDADRYRAQVGGSPAAALSSTVGVELSSGRQLAFSADASDGTQAKDTGIGRVAPGVGSDTDGGAGLGWRQWAGESYLAADATNATATLASSGLSCTVKAGRKYGFTCMLFVSDSTAAEGVKIDFGGGSAAATNFRAQAVGYDTALQISSQLTSLTAPASAGTFTGAGAVEIEGSFEPSSDGTFRPRFAQNTHVVGTLTLFRGSRLLMWDMP